MPYRRKSRLHFDMKNQIPRCVQLTNTVKPPPNVCVKPDNGEAMPNTMEGKTVQQTLMPKKTPQPQTVACNKFAVPQYNTTIRNRAEIGSLQQMRAALGPELTPRSLAAIAPKVTQKMNFPPNRPVFYDVSPLNINDSLRTMDRPKDVAAKPKETNSKRKLVEPQLTDYLENIQHVQLLMSEPQVQLDFPNEDFDFLRAYKKIYGFC